jgi:predicted kinase
VSDIDVLFLHGSPGAGKTTLAEAVAELLREADLPHGVIDLDELARVHPYQDHSFARENLRAIWPHYAALPGIRLLVAGVIESERELVLLRDALVGANVVVCELTAPEAVLKARVTAREPNEFWRAGLRRWVDVYHARTDLDGIRDFFVSTDDRSEEDAAREIIAKLGWLL